MRFIEWLQVSGGLWTVLTLMVIAVCAVLAVVVIKDAVEDHKHKKSGKDPYLARYEEYRKCLDK